MTTKLCVALIVVCGIAGQPLVAAAGEREPLLPHPAHGKLRYASGKLASTGGTVEHYRFTAVQKNRFVGKNRKTKSTNLITVEIVPGASKAPCPILVLRVAAPLSGGPNPGHTALFVGKRVGRGRYAGNWYNNQGESGEFELALTKD